MKTFDCAAILFDLDGVLVDSTGSVTRQWRRWAEEQSLDPDEVVEIAHGVRTIEIVRRLAPHLDAKAETLRLERRTTTRACPSCRAPRNYSRPFPQAAGAW